MGLFVDSHMKKHCEQPQNKKKGLFYLSLFTEIYDKIWRDLHVLWAQICLHLKLQYV